jgi:hypothetical protein
MTIAALRKGTVISMSRRGKVEKVKEGENSYRLSP